MPLSLASSVGAAYAIEAAGYPADEAATREKLDFRLKHAGDYFWGAYSEHGALLGFVCGTLTKAETLTEESMSEHDADGATLCIHSVVTLTALRRKGLGQWMVRAYRASVAYAAQRTAHHPRSPCAHAHPRRLPVPALDARKARVSGADEMLATRTARKAGRRDALQPRGALCARRPCPRARRTCPASPHQYQQRRRHS